MPSILAWSCLACANHYPLGALRIQASDENNASGGNASDVTASHKGIEYRFAADCAGSERRVATSNELVIASGVGGAWWGYENDPGSTRTLSTLQITIRVSQSRIPASRRSWGSLSTHRRPDLHETCQSC